MTFGRGAVSLLVTGVIVSSGCSTPLGLTRDENASVQTRAMSYTARPIFGILEVRVTYTFRNTARETAYIMRCRRPFVRVEKREGGEWVRTPGGARVKCAQPPIAVPPGDEWTDQICLARFFAHAKCLGTFIGPEPDGTYRLVIDQAVYGFDEAAGPPWGRPLPLEQRVSNRFRIRVP